MATGLALSNKTLTAITLIALTACSTQEVKQDTSVPPSKDSPTTANDTLQLSGPNPPLTVMKDGIQLNLVRIMDGGACKNDLQGVKGTFLLYANPRDIDRIKKEKGPKIFSDFENKIQNLSAEALHKAIDESNLTEDPFALDEDEAHQKLAKQLTENFRKAISGPIKTFEKETTLTIDISTFSPSFIFYQEGCELIETDENPDAAN